MKPSIHDYIRHTMNMNMSSEPFIRALCLTSTKQSMAWGKTRGEPLLALLLRPLLIPLLLLRHLHGMRAAGIASSSGMTARA